MSQKTLFNYFNKSPASTTPKSEKKTNKSTYEKTPVSKTSASKTPSSKLSNGVSNGKSNESEGPVKKNGNSRKRIIETKDASEDEEESPSKKKPEGYLLDSEDSGDEFIPDEKSEDEDEDISEASEHEPLTQSEEETPGKHNKKRKRTGERNKPNKKPQLNTQSSKSKETLKPSPISVSSNAVENGTSDGGSGGDGQNWTHLGLTFLKQDKIRDAKRRPPSDPNYDPRTLYVPEDFLRSQTPGHRQWWDLKMNNFDCIIFFKVGKFYELYHMDAVTAMKELSLTFMRGEYAHCGFPEIAYGRFSANLVDKGYKVARIEQTETPDMMNERLKNTLRPTKFDKVVNREICQLTTKGTRIFTVVEGEAKEAQCQYLLAITEQEKDSVKSTYGVCFVDTSIGTFHVGQFEDDRHSSRLRTMIALHPPVQILYERNRLSKRTLQILNTAVSSAVKESLAPETEFWTSSTTLMKLAERKYFEEGKLPETLKKFVGEEDSLGLTASETSELAIKSLGAVIWTLTRCLLDFQLVSLGQFQVYVPVDAEPSLSKTSTQVMARNMVLDAVTLKNLNILDNGAGGLQGTLLNQIDHCLTPFGKRLLRQWLCSPLTNINSIKARQKSISILQENLSVMKDVSDLLSKVPDLERLLSRIYAQSSKGLENSHPDNRAVMFEERTYSKRKIVEFISVLNGFQLLQDAVKLMQESGICDESEILRNCVYFPSSEAPGLFPDLTENLTFFKNAFDHAEAEKEGRIIPSAGVDAEYDSAMETLAEIDRDLKDYLKTQCQHFGCKVTYVGTDKKRFQLEVSESGARKAGDGYELQGQRKGFKKYYTSETKELLERQIAAEEVKNKALLDLRKRIFARFSDRMPDWTMALNCVATLDVLMSLTRYSNSIEGDICTPQFHEPQQWKKPYIKAENGKFPCGGSDFIPNDTLIGGDGPNIMLLTGPNMGGKSTLMRQLGLLSILAQMGCMVPAASLEMTVVDRIFTRIGANDDIMAGDSTFYLELCETSAILSHASAHSLVLIDELGRGTSTYDGTAIAAAVLHELCRMESRTIFSTHYHSLVGSFKDDSNIKLAHMACMAEGGGTEAEDEDADEEGSEERVTFLYKVAEGACPSSYGFNAARLAGVPSHITRRGARVARSLAQEAASRKVFRAIFGGDQFGTGQELALLLLTV